MSRSKRLSFAGVFPSGSAGQRGFKKSFLDVQMLSNRMDNGTRIALLKAGGLMRRHVRGYKLRRRKGTSQPGRPPNIHTTGSGVNLRHVLFSWDDSSRSMIVGPVFFKRTLGQPVPQLLEGGGGAYRARPYMRPAFEELQNKGLIMKEFAGVMNVG